MKIAVTYENGSVFQHFGHTEQFKLYDVEDGKVVNSAILPTGGFGHGALAEAGIQLYAGVQGSADAAVEALLAGTLSYSSDANCGHHHGEGHECGHHHGDAGCEEHHGGHGHGHGCCHG